MNQGTEKYEIIIFWSDEDGAYLADVPELPGCTAHGETREDALKNAETAAQLSTSHNVNPSKSWSSRLY